MGRNVGPSRARILEVAGQQFSEHGFDGVSIRAIATTAGTRQSLVHYHFNTKLELYREIWARWYVIPELGQADALEGIAAGAPIARRTEEVVLKFFRGPMMLRETEEGRQFLSILGRELSDPKAAERDVLAEFLGPTEAIFMRGFQQLFPQAGQLEISVSYRLLASAAQALFIDHARPTQAEHIFRSDFEGSVHHAARFVAMGIIGICSPACDQETG